MRIKITKSYGRGGFTMGDVKISLNKNGGGRIAVVVVFYNDNYKKISTTEYAIPSLDEELGRLYFETGNPSDGFKLSQTSESSARRISFIIKDKETWASRSGSYNLLYDTNEKLYYIDFANKFKV